jgi:hypothetical protein
MTTTDLIALMPFIIPTITGILIPFVTNAINRIVVMPDWLQSFVYVALSALAAVIPTVQFDKDLRAYFIALGIAWLISMRTHYTTIPDKLIPPYRPRHALNEDRIVDNIPKVDRNTPSR